MALALALTLTDGLPAEEGGLVPLMAATVGLSECRALGRDRVIARIGGKEVGGKRYGKANERARVRIVPLSVE